MYPAGMHPLFVFRPVDPSFGIEIRLLDLKIESPACCCSLPGNRERESGKSQQNAGGSGINPLRRFDHPAVGWTAGKYVYSDLHQVVAADGSAVKRKSGAGSRHPVDFFDPVGFPGGQPCPAARKDSRQKNTKPGKMLVFFMA